MADQPKEHHKKKHKGHHNKAKQLPVPKEATVQVATREGPEPTESSVPTAPYAMPMVRHEVSPPMRTVQAPLLVKREDVVGPMATTEAHAATPTPVVPVPVEREEAPPVTEEPSGPTPTEAVGVEARAVELPTMETPVEPPTERMAAPIYAPTEVWLLVASSGGLMLGQSQHEYAVYDQKNNFGSWPLTEEGYRLATQTYQAHRQSLLDLPGPAPREQPVYTRGWFWLIALVVLGIGACSALVFGLNRAAPASHTIVYSVTGNGQVLNIMYASPQGGIGQSGEALATTTNLPWFRRVTVSGDSTDLGLGSTIGSGGGSVTCTITEDGHQIATNTASGAFALADCTHGAG